MDKKILILPAQTPREVSIPRLYNPVLGADLPEERRTSRFPPLHSLSCDQGWIPGRSVNVRQSINHPIQKKNSGAPPWKKGCLEIGSSLFTPYKLEICRASISQHVLLVFRNWAPIIVNQGFSFSDACYLTWLFYGSSPPKQFSSCG